MPDPFSPYIKNGGDESGLSTRLLSHGSASCFHFAHWPFSSSYHHHPHCPGSHCYGNSPTALGSYYHPWCLTWRVTVTTNVTLSLLVSVICFSAVWSIFYYIFYAFILCTIIFNVVVETCSCIERIPIANWWATPQLLIMLTSRTQAVVL